MKILHSKSTAEPILLVSTCPSMNLLAVVTPTNAVVYRSTTLTVIVSLPLDTEQQQPCRGKVQAAWSPSGRILALALSHGVVLLVDVEEGKVIRRLVPQASTENAATTSSFTEREPNGTGNAANGESREEADTAADAEDVEEVARHLSCEVALASPPSVPLSIPSEPVVAMTWASVNIPASGTQGSVCSALANAAAKARCLPLHTTLSQPLLEEMETVTALSTLSVSAPNSISASSRGVDTAPGSQVHLLTLLSASGVLSVVAGGLQEVYSGVLETPPPPLDAAQFLVTSTPSSDAFRQVKHILRGLHDKPSFPLSDLRTLLAAAATTPDLANHSERISDAAAGRSHRYHGYLVTRQKSGQGLMQMDLCAAFHGLASPRVPVLCRVMEYYSAASLCLTNAQRRWAELIHGRTRPHLRLPEAAPLLRDAVVEALRLPATSQLEAYYAALDRPALADDLDRIALVQSVIANDVYNICYRAYDQSLTLVSVLRDAARLWDGAGPSGSESTAPSDTYCRMYDDICNLLSEHRRYCENFLLRIRQEGMEEINIITFALQRASLLFDVPGSPTAGPLDDEGNPSTADAVPFSFGGEPLPTAKQPSVLAALERIIDSLPDTPPRQGTRGGREDTNALRAAHSTDSSSIVMQERMKVLLHKALTGQDASQKCGSNENKSTLACRVVPLCPDSDAVLQLDVLSAESVAEASDDALHGNEEADREDGGDETSGTADLAVYGTRCASGPHPAPRQQMASAPIKVTGCRVTAAADYAELSFEKDPAIAVALPTNPCVACYSRMERDQHVLLYTTGEETKQGEAVDGFTLVMVDDTGAVKLLEADDDDDDADGSHEDGDGEGRDAEETENAAVANATDDVVAATTSCSGYNILEVRGMAVTPETLLASVSKGRQFGVIASGHRFVVVDLFEE